MWTCVFGTWYRIYQHEKCAARNGSPVAVLEPGPEEVELVNAISASGDGNQKW